MKKRFALRSTLTATRESIRLMQALHCAADEARRYFSKAITRANRKRRTRQIFMTNSTSGPPNPMPRFKSESAMLTTINTTTVTSTARKISMLTANGSTRANTGMSGNHTARRSAVIMIGRRIAMVTGAGFRPTAGRGLMTSRGAGRHIITDAGFPLTVSGFGLHTVRFAEAGVGGDRL